MTRDGIDFIEKDEVVVKREDLDEAMVFLIACRPTFKKAKNVRDISKLIDRLRAAKEGNHG